jgi:hypothetical protein
LGLGWLAYAKNPEDRKRPTPYPPAFVLEYQSWPCFLILGLELLFNKKAIHTWQIGKPS